MIATVTPLRQPAQAPLSKAALDRLQALVADELAQVNLTIIDRMQSPVALIPELAGHLISSGGKRLRPMLTLACAHMLGYTGMRHHKLAACVEFIHTATLLHDDVVDDSGLRRGRKTANTVWGNQPSVLVGDFLFSRAFELMVEDGNLAVLKILSRASAIIAQGEVQQLTTAHDLTCTEDRYLDVITSKTAVLFAAACQIAAVVAEREASVENALEAYGRNLGIAFQLVDDALDYNSSAADMGKDAGDDFREGKLTLPVILAYARADADQRKFWERCIGRLKQEEGDFDRAVMLMKNSHAISDTLGRAKLYGARAKDALAALPDGPAKSMLAKSILLDTVDFAIARGY
jgi:octaprenyl-diphosphate synthase